MDICEVRIAWSMWVWDVVDMSGECGTDMGLSMYSMFV
jgi:hypothetical protein